MKRKRKPCKMLKNTQSFDIRVVKLLNQNKGIKEENSNSDDPKLFIYVFEYLFHFCIVK